MLTLKWPKKLPNPSHKVNYTEMLVQSQLGHYYSVTCTLLNKTDITIF